MKRLVILIVLFWINYAMPVFAATGITGVISDSAGKAVAGALVKVSSVDTGLTYMVVSGEEGRYSTPALIPGQYTVRALGGKFQGRATAPVEAGNNQVVVDVVINTARTIPAPPVRLTNADYKQLMPEGNGKELIASRCVMCHGLDRVVPARKAPEAWQTTLNRMAYYLEERPDLGGALSAPDKQAILNYISVNFSRNTPRIPEPVKSDPDQHLPLELLSGPASRFVVMEFDTRTNSERNEFGVDSRGNVWITEGGTPYFGMFDPSSLRYTRVEMPADKYKPALAQIAADPDDNIWILNNSAAPESALVKYNPRSREFRSYPVPLPANSPKGYLSVLNTLRFLDGDIWGTGNVSSRVVRLDPRTGKITEYPVKRGSHPYGIAIGKDKAVWYITNYNNEIIRLDPDTGNQTPYQALTPRSGLRRMSADGQGNLWVGGQDSNKLVKLDTRTGKVTEYTAPTNDAGPYSVDVDTKRNLIWFSERDGNKLGRFDPSTGGFTEFPLLTAGIEARRIVVDPVNPNRIWWGCASSIDRFGYLEILE